MKKTTMVLLAFSAVFCTGQELPQWLKEYELPQEALQYLRDRGIFATDYETFWEA